MGLKIINTNINMCVKATLNSEYIYWRKVKNTIKQKSSVKDK